MGNVLVFNNDTYTLSGAQYRIGDFFTQEYYQYIDNIIDNFYSGEIYDNYIYLTIFQQIQAIAYFIKTNHIKKVDILQRKGISALMTYDAAKIAAVDEINFNGNVKYMPVFWNYIRCFCGAAYLFLLQIRQKKDDRMIDYHKNLCVLREKQAFEKIKKDESREIFYETKVGIGDFYTHFSLGVRFLEAGRAAVQAVGLLRKADRYLESIGIRKTKKYMLSKCDIRFSAVCYYGNLLNRIMSEGWKGCFISGNNADMYAMIEEKTAQKYKIDTVCIPHGLEYGFKLPHCFTGNKFYTTSEYTADYLNNLYGKNKFVFDRNIVISMFCKNAACTKKRVVYFSEPRDSKINLEILDELLDRLGKYGIQLYIKHHPIDKLKEYEVYGSKLKVIDNLTEAISGNICIARKSTILLEALYNNSVSAAILISEKDKSAFHMYPSLQDERINVFVNYDMLVEWIIVNMH